MVVRRVLELRWRKRLGPLQLAARTGVAASTVHKILTRNRMNRLNYVDQATGEPIRRYEHDHPGSLIHVDVKKLGNIPDGGGWRFVGRPSGSKNRSTLGSLLMAANGARSSARQGRSRRRGVSSSMPARPR